MDLGALTPLEHALSHARRGWRVFPVRGEKPPTGWPTLATTDADTITKWWTEHPDARVAIATGPGSRLLVVDLDQKKGHDGLGTWHAFTPDGYTFRGPTVTTKSGGGHLYYETDYDYRNSAGKLGDGVDTRSGGGFVYAPGSPGYEWLDESTAYVPPTPEWLHDALAPRERADGTTPTVTRSRLGDLLDNVPTEGGRNVWLSQVAGHYAKRFPDARDLYERFVAMAIESMPEPLPFEEAFRTAASIWDAEQAKPTHEIEVAEEGAENLEWDTAEAIPMEVAEWTWGERNGARYGRIPSGSLVLLAGREGVGKSTLVWDLAASLTRGTLPGEFFGVPSTVAVVATEDSWGHTIKPRLVAAEAVLSKVWRIQSKREANGVTLPRDVDELRRGIVARSCPLVVLDPLISRLDGKLDTHKDADVRRALEPLAKLADETGTAILGLIHVNKQATTNPLDAIMASKAFTAVARSVLLAATDPSDKEKPARRVLVAHSKSNLGPKMPTLVYVLSEAKVGKDAKGREVWATAITWDGQDERDDREIMDETNAAKRETAQDRADALADTMRQYLEAQPNRTARKLDVIAHMTATKGKPSARTVERVAKQMGLESKREAVKGGPVTWTLPEEF